MGSSCGARRMVTRGWVTGKGGLAAGCGARRMVTRGWVTNNRQQSMSQSQSWDRQQIAHSSGTIHVHVYTCI